MASVLYWKHYWLFFCIGGAAGFVRRNRRTGNLSRCAEKTANGTEMPSVSAWRSIVIFCLYELYDPDLLNESKQNDQICLFFAQLTDVRKCSWIERAAQPFQVAAGSSLFTKTYPQVNKPWSPWRVSHKTELCKDIQNSLWFIHTRIAFFLLIFPVTTTSEIASGIPVLSISFQAVRALIYCSHLCKVKYTLTKPF